MGASHPQRFLASRRIPNTPPIKQNKDEPTWTFILTHLLPQPRVGHGKHRCFQDRRVLQHSALHLCTRHLLTPAVHKVLLPAAARQTRMLLG